MADERTKPPDGGGCSHYWVIQPATGPVSQGLCQTCGLTREFKNYIEAFTWGEDRASGRPKKRTLAEGEDEAEERLLDAYEEEEAFAD